MVHKSFEYCGHKGDVHSFELHKRAGLSGVPQCRFGEVEVTEIDRFESSTGNLIVLRAEGSRWEVANLAADGEAVWTETSVSGDHPFSEEEARAEFERWRT